MGLGLAWVGCALGSAHAYQLDDHERMTKTAAEWLKTCHTLSFSDAQVRILIKANRSEDTDVIRKWGGYSHYYNPHHTIEQRRKDSMASIVEVERALRDQPPGTKSIELLGRAIHHIQDSAVPLHVLPVNHALDDGFEGYGNPKSALIKCSAMEAKAPESLQDVLKRSALATYDRIKTTFSYQHDGAERSQSWLGAFWTEPKGRGFGSYGDWGNRFGMIRFNVSGTPIQVEREVYETFHNETRVQAVLASVSAFLWYQANHQEL